MVINQGPGGFAVTSRRAGTLCDAVFDHVAFNGPSSYVPPSWPVPNAPTNVSATPISTSQIRLDWTNNSPNTSVLIERSTDGVTFTRTPVTAHSTDRATVFGHNAGTTYYFRLRAYNPGYYSPRSEIASATTLASGDTVPIAPYTGGTIVAYASPDGVTWSAIATINLDLGATVHVGFAVTAHDNTKLNTAVFGDPFIR